MNAAIETEPTRTCSPLPGKSGSVDPTPQSVSASSAERPVLAIGDIHGHLDRFEALLRQEGLLDWCPDCDGSGEHAYEVCDSDTGVRQEFEDCRRCDGDGWARTDKEATVVLLGDVGHFGKGGSPTGDLLSWRAAINWADVILWGNHDRACVEPWHAFNGYMKPTPEVYHLFERARREGKLKLAYAAHGYLMTHAGLALAFRNQQIPDRIKEDPYEFAAWINAVEDPGVQADKDEMAVRDAVGHVRGGRGTGGILWRDLSEKLYDKFPQVFGHSADHGEHDVRYCWKTGYTRKLHAFPEDTPISYCVDIGGKGDKTGDDCLAGVWLPEGRVVRVDLSAKTVWLTNP